MSDREDYTLPVSIIAITIASLPVDIIAQTVGNLDIDIAAQSVGNIDVNLAASAITLNVNIASSGVTLNVNISSSTTLDVDITAQSIGNLSIDITAQSVSIDFMSIYETKAGNGIDVCGIATVATATWTSVASRTVPAGKTLYIFDWGAHIYSAAATFAAQLRNVTDNIVLGVCGGNRGFQSTFTKPKTVAANKNVAIEVVHQTGSNEGFQAHFGGTET